MLPLFIKHRLNDLCSDLHDYSCNGSQVNHKLARKLSDICFYLIYEV